MFKGVRLNPPVTWLSSALNALLPMLKPEYVAFKVGRAIDGARHAALCVPT